MAMKRGIIKMLRNKTPVAILGVLLICFVFISCDHKEDYYRFCEIKDGKWGQHDTLIFDIDSAHIELNTVYNIAIEITNNNDYPYRNFWCFVEDNISNDSIVDRTNIELILADEFGKWKGSGFGALYQSSTQLKEQISFAEKRNYRICILQGMRDEPLAGIEKVGIKIFRDE